MLDRRRRRGKDLPARQQISVPGASPSASHYLVRRGRGAQGEESARQDRLRLFRRSVLQGGADGGASSRPRQPASRWCWTNPTRRRPPISARSSTRSFRRMPTRSWAAVTIPDGATLARQMLRPESQHEMGDDPGRARQTTKFAELGDGRGRRDGAVAMGAAGHLQAANSARPRAEFAKAFEAKFHAEADYHAASGYTDGLILQHAIEQAGSIEPEKVAAELNKIDVTTFFGQIKFAHRSRAITACRWRTRWCWRSGRRRTASWNARWSGRTRRQDRRSVIYPLQSASRHSGAGPALIAGPDRQPHQHDRHACFDHRRRAGRLGLWPGRHGHYADLGRHGRDQSHPWRHDRCRHVRRSI